MNKEEKYDKIKCSKDVITVEEEKKLSKLDCGHFEIPWLLKNGRSYCKQCALNGKHIFDL